MRVSLQIVVVLCFTVIVGLLANCKNGAGTSTAQTGVLQVNLRDTLEGKALAAKYCQSCHQLPEPSLLDKQTWQNHVLPVMGLFLGMKTPAMTGGNIRPGSDLSYLPASPVIDSVQWNKIASYFIAAAPEHLPVSKQKEPAHQLPFFNVELPAAKWYSTMAIASYVKIDNSVVPHRLIVNDGMARKLAILENHAGTLRSYTLNGPVVDLFFQKDKVAAVTIGKDLTANNLKNGDVTEIAIDKNGAITPQPRPLFDKLARPVGVNIADVNGDGRSDYLIAQYGNLAGRLSLMENLGTGFKETVLREKPGCLKTIISDANGDGLPDIWALFAQGDESIFLYTNKGMGNFEEKQVLRFPPSYGSTSFDMVDLNKDGYPDIIYTCGDNGDYSQVLKSYHGLYIYLNDGKNNFKQNYFYPINGCYKAIARDYDGDGDLDIATISNFPAAVKPWEAFIYFENKGGFQFQPYTLPLNVPFQKGLTMDAGDIDGNGKTDLLLGNGFYTSDKSGRYTQPLFVVLKNMSSHAGNRKKSKH